MALNNSKCNHLMPLYFKELICRSRCGWLSKTGSRRRGAHSVAAGTLCVVRHVSLADWWVASDYCLQQQQ